jgi:hypothetical protein
MEKKFSQGLWERIGNTIVVGKKTIAVATKCDPKSNYARDGKYPYNFDEVEANAKLLYSAPELLECCLTAKAMYEAQGITEDSRIGGSQLKELNLVIKKATE